MWYFFLCACSILLLLCSSVSSRQEGPTSNYILPNINCCKNKRFLSKVVKPDMWFMVHFYTFSYKHMLPCKLKTATEETRTPDKPSNCDKLGVRRMIITIRSRRFKVIKGFQLFPRNLETVLGDANLLAMIHVSFQRSWTTRSTSVGARYCIMLPVVTLT